MGVLLAVTGLIAVLFRSTMKKILKDPHKGEKLEKFLHILSGGAMMIFAAFMLAGVI